MPFEDEKVFKYFDIFGTHNVVDNVVGKDCKYRVLDDIWRKLDVFVIDKGKIIRK